MCDGRHGAAVDSPTVNVCPGGRGHREIILSLHEPRSSCGGRCIPSTNTTKIAIYGWVLGGWLSPDRNCRLARVQANGGYSGTQDAVEELARFFFRTPHVDHDEPVAVRSTLTSSVLEVVDWRS